MWVVVGLAAFCLLGLILLAGAAVFFVTRHISTERSSSANAIRSFDEVRATFPGQKPLYELDSSERPMMTRPFSEIPSSSTRPEQVRLLAWDPHDERLVRVALPFWMLRMHKAKVDLSRDGTSFDLEHLQLDGEELERIGPALLFDYREPHGARVLVWTQ